MSNEYQRIHDLQAALDEAEAEVERWKERTRQEADMCLELGKENASLRTQWQEGAYGMFTREDYAELREAAKAAVDEFDQTNWGQKQEVKYYGNPRMLALATLVKGKNAKKVARCYNDVDQFGDAAQRAEHYPKT